MWWLDDYERRARLVPGLWLMAPIVVCVFMFGLRANLLVSSAGGLLIAAGAPVLLSSLVRQRGLAIEAALVRTWGGWPTTQLMTAGTPSVLQSRRTAIEQATGMVLPPADEPDSDAYDVATTKLRTLTRSKVDYPLVFEENRNYGFERNLLGVQPLARVTSTVALVASVAAACLVAVHRHTLSPDLWIGSVFLLAIAAFWFCYPSQARARTVAFKYAERLVEALDK